YSRVAIVKNDKPEVIANAQGAHSTPSVVAFNENETLVGEVAYNFGTKNPTNTVFDAKRFLGRNQDDEVLSSEGKRWRFNVMYKEQKPVFQVPYNGSPTNFTPEQICGQIFANLKSTAEAYMHTNIRNAVLCCPAHFTSQQREELIHSACDANLSVLLVISKPIATAIAYDLDKNDSGQQTILIFSMGARSCEVVVLDVNTGCFQERSVKVDHSLGGDAIDDILVDWFVDQFKRKHKLDPSESHRSLFKIRSGCENAKRQLSQTASTRVEVESAHEGLDFSQNLSRAKFEEMVSVISAVVQLLRSVYSAGSINKVLMAGGCSRIPKVQSIVQQSLPDVEVCLNILPDEAGVLGTAIQGSTLVGSSWSTAEANSSNIEISALPRVC
ncbi:heat shock protein 70-like protein, partial [Guillardia theta CCMP2712]